MATTKKKIEMDDSYERTDDEVIEFYKSVMGNDFFGFMAGDLLLTLPFEKAKPFLSEQATSEQWSVLPKDRGSVLARMKDYMGFAWEKCTGHRGLSASRSVQHFISWLFLAGDDVLAKFSDDHANYAPYGAPILKAISEKYGFDIPQDEDAQRMIRGEACSDDCRSCLS